MTHPTDTLADRLEALLAKATPGPWEWDTERNEDGAYGGGGPDHGTGYDDFLIGAPGRDGKWMTLFGSENSTVKLIDEDYDEDYHRAWDRVGEANAALIVEAINALPALLSALRSTAKEVDALREAMERIGWHELTARETRDVARAALSANEREAG